jgi:hypothetical protein
MRLDDEQRSMSQIFLLFEIKARRRVGLEDSRCTGLSGIAKAFLGSQKLNCYLFLLSSNMQTKWFSWPIIPLSVVTVTAEASSFLVTHMYLKYLIE